MSSENSVAAVRRFFDELFNQGILEVADAIIAPNCVNGPQPWARGPATFKRVVVAIHRAFSEARFTIDDLAAADGVVVTRNTFTGTHRGDPGHHIFGGVLAGLPATGRTVASDHIHWFKVGDGLITEHQAVRDDWGLFQQLTRSPGEQLGEGDSPGR
jgi:predicted ester cyclase